MKKLFGSLIILSCLLSSCTNENIKNQEDIIILYTSDIHCSIEDGIGYEGLAAYKKNLEKTNKYVALVDLGDAVQGGPIGAVSKGSYIIDIMNYVGYDHAIFGNHEFDYGLDAAKTFIDSFDGEYLVSNIEYEGSKENLLSGTKPYDIVSYGDIDVAYIGISTPYSLTSTTPTFFQEDGEYVYNFFGGDNGNILVNRIQGYVDECLEKGADYVIALAHLGATEETTPYTAQELISKTNGIDVILDGHAHVKIPCGILENKDGEEVLLGSVGTAFDAFGQLTITANGNLSLTSIDEYSKKDQKTEEYIDSIVSLFEEEFNKPIIEINRTLSINDENGIRKIRSREMPIGNLVADGYRFLGNTDVAFVNSAGIKADLNQGEVSYADVYKIHPYGNAISSCYCSGQEIIDSLEISARLVQKEYTDGTISLGENSGFLQVSGLKFEIDTSIPTSVILDANEDFVEIAGARRVKNIKILQNGEYVDIDPNKTYTVSSVDYIIKHGGSANNLFLDNELLIEEGLKDYQVLLNYLVKGLNGDLSSYDETEGRITIL